MELDNEILLENLEASIIVVDHAGFIRKVNISTETLFEQSRRYLVGMPLRELIDSVEVERCAKEVLNSNAQYTLRELNIDFDDKEVLVDMTLSQVSYSQGEVPYVLIEMHSINRISRFMKEQNQLERQQSFRLMMRSLAHEIKNPLGGIRGAAQLLDREIAEPSHQELTNILIKEADRLTRLVDRVMGSREQLKLKAINVHEVIEHVIHLVKARGDSECEIVRRYDPTLPEIMADKEQMIQAVLNVAINAIEVQADSEKPTIGFTTQFERFVTVNQELHKRALKLTIWDNGPGVKPELREILFDPLITGRPEGSGLGLSITQEIIQRHKGAVQLEDCEPHTCFSIYLPYLSGEQASHHIDGVANEF